MQEISYSKAILETIRNEMKKDRRIVLMGEDIGRLGNTFKVLDGLWDEFGSERVIEAPISEASIVGAAIGAALSGLIPVFEIMYIDFATLAMEQIINRAAKMSYMSGGELNLPLVIRTQGGGRSCQAAQHSQSLEALFCHIPGLKVCMPSCPNDARGLLITAIKDNNPVIFIEHKMLYSKKGFVDENEDGIPFACAKIRKEGKDVTIISWSDMVNYSLEAANDLENEGINAEVIDLRTLVPLDKETIFNSVKKTGKVLIAHEAIRRGGYGAQISSLISENIFPYLKSPIKIIAAKNYPIPFSPSRIKPIGYGAMPSLVELLEKCTDPLEEYVLPQKKQIIDCAKQLFNYTS